MPDTQITNPLGAFGAPVIGVAPFAEGVHYVVLVAGVTTIKAGMPVAFNTVATTGQAIVAAGATGVSIPCGISLDTVGTTGNIIRVATEGVVKGLCVAPSGGVTAGNVYAATTAGAFGASSAVIGENIILALTTAASGVTFDAFVHKM